MNCTVCAQAVWHWVISCSPLYSTRALWGEQVKLIILFFVTERLQLLTSPCWIQSPPVNFCPVGSIFISRVLNNNPLFPCSPSPRDSTAHCSPCRCSQWPFQGRKWGLGMRQINLVIAITHFRPTWTRPFFMCEPPSSSVLLLNRGCESRWRLISWLAKLDVSSSSTAHLQLLWLSMLG